MRRLGDRGHTVTVLTPSLHGRFPELRNVRYRPIPVSRRPTRRSATSRTWPASTFARTWPDARRRDAPARTTPRWPGLGRRRAAAPAGVPVPLGVLFGVGPARRPAPRLAGVYGRHRAPGVRTERIGIVAVSRVLGASDRRSVCLGASRPGSRHPDWRRHRLSSPPDRPRRWRLGVTATPDGRWCSASAAWRGQAIRSADHRLRGASGAAG